MSLFCLTKRLEKRRVLKFHLSIRGYMAFRCSSEIDILEAIINGGIGQVSQSAQYVFL